MGMGLELNCVFFLPMCTHTHTHAHAQTHMHTHTHEALELTMTRSPGRRSASVVETLVPMPCSNS